MSLESLTIPQLEEKLESMRIEQEAAETSYVRARERYRKHGGLLLFVEFSKAGSLCTKISWNIRDILLLIARKHRGKAVHALAPILAYLR